MILLNPGDSKVPIKVENCAEFKPWHFSFHMPLENTGPVDTMMSFWSILSWYTKLAVISAGLLIVKSHDIPNNADNKSTPRKDKLPQLILRIVSCRRTLAEFELKDK